MSLDWYPFFVLDYRKDTRHLDLEQDGAYRRLIDEYMLTREPLPNDDAALARIIGIPTTDWHRLAPVVRRFFRARNDRLFHKRCDREIRAQNERHIRNKKRAQKAGMANAFKIKMMRSISALAPSTIQYTNKTTSSEYDAEADGPPRRDAASPYLIASEGRRKKP